VKHPLYGRIGVYVALAALALSPSCMKVEPGYVAIEVPTCSDSVDEYDTVSVGWNTFNPGCTDIFEFPIHVQNITWTANPTEGSPTDESIRFSTVDDQAIGVNLAIDYQYAASKVATMFDTFRVDDRTFVDTHLRNRIRDAFNQCVINPQGVDNNGQAIGALEVQDLSPYRVVLFDCVQNSVNAHFEQYGVNIGQIGQIGEFIWPPTVSAAIEASVKATTDAQRVVNELEQTAAEAEKVREEARGVADAALIAAEGRAKARMTEAQAEADANTMIARSLTGTLVQYKKIERWDGQQPSTVLGGNTSAFIGVGGSGSQ